MAMPQHVVDRIAEALNEAGKPLKGSQVCVLGVAYKKDVDPITRESPAFPILELLQQRGAAVTYNDPHVPRSSPKMRHHSIRLESQPLNEEFLAAQDCVVIVTDHSDYDYPWLVQHARLRGGQRASPPRAPAHRGQVPHLEERESDHIPVSDALRRSAFPAQRSCEASLTNRTSCIEETRMSICLVTGGSAGFIGSHLVEALLERGDEVRVMDNLSTGSLANLEAVRDRVDVLIGDLVHLDLVPRGDARRRRRLPPGGAGLGAAKRGRSDVHASGVRHGHAERAAGGARCRRAARGLRRQFQRLRCARNGCPSWRNRSDAAVVALHAVAQTGRRRHYCAAFSNVYGLETVRLRYFNVFGPRQSPDSPYAAVIPLFIEAMSAAGQSPLIHGDGQQFVRDFHLHCGRDPGEPAERRKAGGRQWPGLQRRLWPADDGLSLGWSNRSTRCSAARISSRSTRRRAARRRAAQSSGHRAGAGGSGGLQARVGHGAAD